MPPATLYRSRDLHPDDLAARQQLITELERARLDAGLTRPQTVARYQQLGYPPITAGAVYAIERATNWRINTIQTLARIHNQQLHIDIAGLEVPDDGDLLAITYQAVRPQTPDHVDELARLVLVNNLVRIRIDAGISLNQFGAALGVSGNAIREFETPAPGIMFAPVQRHARVLGGHITFRLSPTTAPVQP